MGGKHKQANRTKNNARPSSSSHSAELLGNTIPTFFGFSSLKNGVTSVPGLSAEDINCNIHSDFQILFKQMNKKDPTTRFKALQLFTELVNNSDIDAVKAILPLWPRMYCMMCTDVDHKVREVSHNAHKAIVSKVKKMIAPYLKELAGPWFTSQYDTYAPAASAATIAFEEAFSSSKLNKVLVFCQEEILSYIYENLINHSPQTLSNPIVISPEDMQAKYERLVLISLQGYNLYLQKLSSDQIQDAEESNKKILSNAKFWKFAKNKVPLIRSSFFQVLISLCQNAKFLLTSESSRLSSIIFNNLDETDPIVFHSIWDAALNILVAVEDCWSHINVEKQLFTKLYNILKSGNRNVSTVYPNILPLLSRLPPTVFRDKNEFYGNLFDNMRSGLKVNVYYQSPSDIKTMATTFLECLKYVILKSTSDTEFCSSLVKNQLVPALEEKLSLNNFKKDTKLPFLIQTSLLIRSWCATHSEEHSLYGKLLADFFLSLFTLYENQLTSEVTRNNLSDILNNQTLFLTILLNPDPFITKNKGHVRFEEEKVMNEMMSVKIEPCEIEQPEELKNFISKIVALYFKNSINLKERDYIVSLSKIVNVFDAKLVFDEMVTAVNESTYFKLFSCYFSKWLMSEEMKCGELVELSFNLLRFVNFDEKEYILDEFCSDWFDDSLQISVCLVLPHFTKYDYVMKWVRSTGFAKIVLKLLERFINDNGEDTASRNVILMLFKVKCNNEEFIFDASIGSLIMSLLSESIEKSAGKPHVVEFSQDLILNSKIEQINHSSFAELIATLFKLSCCKAETEKLLRTCHTGLQLIISSCRRHNLDFDVTRKLSDKIREIIINNEEYSLDQIIDNINTYIELATNTNLKDSCSSNQEICNALEIIKQFLQKDDKINSWKKEGMKILEKCCRVGYEGEGLLDLEYLEMEKYLKNGNCSSIWEKYPRFDSDVIQKYVKWNLYAGSVMNLIVAAHPRCYKTSVLSKDFQVYRSVDENFYEAKKVEDVILMEISKEEEAKLRNDLELIENVFHEDEYKEENNIKEILKDIYEFLMAVSLLECFNKYYSNTKHYKELKGSVLKLKMIATELLKNVNLVEFEFIYSYCKTSIRQQSTWWIIKSTFKEIFSRNFIECQDNEVLKKKNIENNLCEQFKKADISKLSINRGNYMKILCLIEMNQKHLLTEKQWDGIFILIHKFFEGTFGKAQLSETYLLILLAISRLYLKLMIIFRNNCKEPFELRIPPEICLAWNEVVVSEVYNKFIPIWRKLSAEWWNKKDIPPEWIIVLQRVSDVILYGLDMRKREKINESVDLAVECVRLMMSPHAVIQITSFQICNSTVPDLVKLDAEIFGSNMSKMFQDEKGVSLPNKKSTNDMWTIKNIEKDITTNQGIVEILLSDFIIGDCCTVEPFTDSFTYTYSYLLLWCFLLNICAEAHSSLCVQYGSWLQAAGYTSVLLESVFKLMPQTVLHLSEVKENYQKCFENFGSLNFREPVESEHIENIACFVYRLFLQRLPNFVREWWNQTENKTSTLVEKVTRLYVSPILISNELKNVQQDRDTGFDNIEIKIYPGSREVVATYTIDEAKMGLVMILPPNYPLRTVKIESSNVVVGTSNWRNLLFNISKYLIHQNGTIWDALVIWKNNLDKKFEGVEECYICFSILQGSSFEIPRLCCHTCKKKFHSNCLYKWFSTSNNSTCPICRNLF